HIPGDRIAANDARADARFEPAVPNRADVLQGLHVVAVDRRCEGDGEHRVAGGLPEAGEAQGEAVAEEVRVEASLELRGALRLELRVPYRLEHHSIHLLPVQEYRGSCFVETQLVGRTGLPACLAVGDTQA